MKMNGDVQGFFRMLAAAILAACMMAGLAGCDESSSKKGGSSTVVPNSAWVYVANNGSHTVSGYEVNYDDGTVAALAASPYPTDGGPWNAVASADGGRLFVTNNSANTVQSFGIDADSGDLTEQASQPTDSGPRALAVTPDGAYVYAGGSTSTVETWSVNSASGALTQQADAAVPWGQPNGAVVNSTGTFFYTVSPNVDTVTIYTIGSGGAATQDFGPYIVGDFGWELALSPDDAHLYVANLNVSSVDVAAVAANGDLSFVETKATGTFPTGVAVTPSGAFVYVSDTGGVRAFARNSTTGGLTALSGSPFAAGTSPEALAIDATGSFLAVADSIDNTLRVYAIDPDTGALTESDASPVSTGSSPRSVAIVNKN